MDSEVIILYISENIPRDLMDDRQSDMFHPCPAESGSTLPLFSAICVAMHGCYLMHMHTHTPTQTL
jgi:hypothetical protein